jgi:1-acyl-sn-glycerol-3-phosphate acyltransferase
MNFLVKFTALLGTSYKFENERVPKMYQLYLFLIIKVYDIIAMIFLRRFHCKFVSKKELGARSKYFF